MAHTVDESAPTATPADEAAVAVPERRDDRTAFILGGTRGLRRRSLGAVGSWVGLTFVGLLMALPLRGLYRFTGGTMEEGFMLYFPERIAKGDVPNVDFLHLYGPGSLHVLTAWYEVFGYSLGAERTFGLLQHMAIVFGLYALARPWGRLAATSVGALAVFYVFTPIGLTAMAWNGGLALVLWSAVFAIRGVYLSDDRRRRRAWFVAGVLAGVALTFRPDLVVALGLLAVWLLWKHRAMRRPAFVGAVVGLLPMWYHLVVAGPRASFEGMFIDPVFRLRAGRELPSPPSWSHLDGALQAVAEEFPPWWRVPHLEASHALFLWFFAMFIVTAILLAYALLVRRRPGGVDGRSTVVLVVALVSVGILPQALQRPDSTHLTWVTCISWPFFVVVLAEVAARLRRRLDWRVAVGIGATAVVVMTATFTALFTFRHYLLHVRVGLGQVPSAVPVSRDGRIFYFGNATAASAIQQAMDDLDAMSTPGERLFVGPRDLRRVAYSDLIVYWMFPELPPATYYMEMDPGLANAGGSSLAADVASADWIVASGIWEGWTEPNTSVDYGSDAPNDVVRRDFCQVGSYEDGLVLLYRRCER